MPKATYMYWQKRFDRVNPDKEIEEKILEVRKNNKDYGYRRIYGALRNLGNIINKKKVHGTTYNSYRELKLAIEKYIKYYNEERIKEKLGWLSPKQYRIKHMTV